MPSVFLSYRRTDADVVGRIVDQLQRERPRLRLFRDVDSIPAGSDFRGEIDRAIAQSDRVVAVIGPDWLTVTNRDGRRRLDDPADFVRQELQAAFAQGKRVIPLLVGGARMPTASELPECIGQLAFQQALPARPDPDFRRDVAILIEQLAPRRGFSATTVFVSLGVIAVIVAALVVYWVWPDRPDDMYIEPARPVNPDEAQDIQELLE